MPPSILQLVKVEKKVFFVTCLLSKWLLLYVDVVWDDFFTTPKLSEVIWFSIWLTASKRSWSSMSSSKHIGSEEAEVC